MCYIFVIFNVFKGKKLSSLNENDYKDLLHMHAGKLDRFNTTNDTESKTTLLQFFCHTFLSCLLILHNIRLFTLFSLCCIFVYFCHGVIKGHSFF